MSDILIRGMELPDKDHLVFVEINNNGEVFVAYDGGRTKLVQYKAIPIQPHGDLIDRDALSNTIEQHYKHLKINRYDRDLLLHYLDVEMAPAIIPVEEVYGQYTDTAGNFHWCGTHSGEHKIKIGEGDYL